MKTLASSRLQHFQALLSVAADITPFPSTETVTLMDAPAEKRWPLPTWATILIGIAVEAIVSGVGVWTISQMGSANDRTISTDGASAGEIEENLTGVTPTSDSRNERRPIPLQFPSPQIRDSAGDNQYTAIDQRETDAYAWSTESSDGDTSVSINVRSSVEALDLGWDEMQRQIPSQISGCVIIYGDGTMHSVGSLFFCVDWDGNFVDTHGRCYDEEFLAYVLHDNPSERVYPVTVVIIDDRANVYVNGEQLSSSSFDTEEIGRRGRIGLFKYWSDSSRR